jgi:hypothetical protein
MRRIVRPRLVGFALFGFTMLLLSSQAAASPGGGADRDRAMLPFTLTDLALVAAGAVLLFGASALMASIAIRPANNRVRSRTERRSRSLRGVPHPGSS